MSSYVEYVNQAFLHEIASTFCAILGAFLDAFFLDISRKYINIRML